jgi:hypothetical protein
MLGGAVSCALIPHAPPRCDDSQCAVVHSFYGRWPVGSSICSHATAIADRPCASPPLYRGVLALASGKSESPDVTVVALWDSLQAIRASESNLFLTQAISRFLACCDGLPHITEQELLASDFYRNQCPGQGLSAFFLYHLGHTFISASHTPLSQQ